jgi:hypothetical protein
MILAGFRSLKDRKKITCEQYPPSQGPETRYKFTSKAQWPFPNRFFSPFRADLQGRRHITPE